MDLERWLWVLGLLLAWLALIALGFWGWRRRGARQADAVGELPPVPEDPGALVLSASTGLYVGSTLAPSWQDRIAVGDLGYRSDAAISAYARGILVDRSGAAPVWIPTEAVRAVRTERGLAGKVMTRDGVLVIRWQLPSGTEIDTGFRADDKRIYPRWRELDPAASDQTPASPGEAR